MSDFPAADFPSSGGHKPGSPPTSPWRNALG